MASFASGPTLGFHPAEIRSDWVRLRTLILLRWMAIAGQIAAITVADRYYQIQLPIGLCYMVVGASVIANLVSSYVYPPTKRLSEAEALLTLMFDITQLSFLIFLTGGLANPFALLILAPVTISATALNLRTTVILGGLAMLGGCAVAFGTLGTAGGLVATGVAMLVLGIVLYVEFVLLPRTRFGRKFFLQNAVDATSQPPLASAAEVVGKFCEAETTLAPTGYVALDGRRYEAYSRSGLALKGARLEIVAVDNFRLIVTKTQT